MAPRLLSRQAVNKNTRPYSAQCSLILQVMPTKRSNDPYRVGEPGGHLDPPTQVRARLRQHVGMCAEAKSLQSELMIGPLVRVLESQRRTWSEQNWKMHSGALANQMKTLPGLSTARVLSSVRQLQSKSGSSPGTSNPQLSSASTQGWRVSDWPGEHVRLSGRSSRCAHLPN